MGAIHKPKLTADQYLEIERAAEMRSDFLDGEMIAMPGGTEAHNTICVNLTVEIGSRAKGKSFRVYTSDMRVQTATGRHYTYPDLTIAVPTAEFEGGKKDILINPCAIFEVLSPSTMAYDRDEKFDLYFGVESFREYILISQDKMQIDRWFRSGHGDWRFSRMNDPQGILKLESVPVEIPLTEIYDRVEFPVIVEESDEADA